MLQNYECFKNNEDVEIPYKGASYMVGMTICNTANVYKPFDIDETIRYFILAKLVSRLTRNEGMKFALIFRKIKDRKNNQEPTKKTSNNDTVPLTISTRIPYSKT